MLKNNTSHIRIKEFLSKLDSLLTISVLINLLLLLLDFIIFDISSKYIVISLLIFIDLFLIVKVVNYIFFREKNANDYKMSLTLYTISLIIFSYSLFYYTYNDKERYLDDRSNLNLLWWKDESDIFRYRKPEIAKTYLDKGYYKIEFMCQRRDYSYIYHGTTMSVIESLSGLKIYSEFIYPYRSPYGSNFSRKSLKELGVDFDFTSDKEFDDDDMHKFIWESKIFYVSEKGLYSITYNLNRLFKDTPDNKYCRMSGLIIIGNTDI